MPKKNNARQFAESNQPTDEPQQNGGIPTSNPHDVLAREVSAPDNTVVEAEEANKPIEKNTYSFFSRVLSIPLVRDSSSIVQNYANQNSIGRFAINKAESTYKMAASIASPYTEKYKHHLLKADQMGCQSLDLVENKFPVVRQDTREIYTTVKQSPHKVYEDVKGKIHHVVQLPVNHATQLVNRYLPAVKEEKESAKATAKSVKEEENNILSLVNEFKERLAHRVTIQLQSIPHSKADVARLAETNILLQETFNSIQKANARLQNLVNSVKGGYTSTQNKANQRINDLTIDLIKRLDSAAAYVKEHQVINLPSSLHVVVDPLFTFASNEYEIVRTEALKEDIAPLQKATNILHLTQEYILPLIQNSIQGVQEQVRQYSDYANNSKVVKDVKSTLGLVSVKA